MQRPRWYPLFFAALERAAFASSNIIALGEYAQRAERGQRANGLSQAGRRRRYQSAQQPRPARSAAHSCAHPLT